MTGGIPIRFRRTQRDMPIDLPSLGEPFLHTIDGKIGVYDGTNMLWYPRIDAVNKRMIMNAGQKLSGKDNANGDYVDISFDTPNAVEIKHRTSNTVLARFDETGASFSSFTPGAQIPGGIFNRMTHPGFLPNLFSSTLKGIPVADKGIWLGPNTYFWKKLASTGSILMGYGVKTGAGLLTHAASDALCLKAQVTADCVDIGVRMWMFDPFMGYIQAGTNNNRFYISVWGEVGKTSKLRLGRNGSYVERIIIGTGSWQRIQLDFPAHLQTTSWITNNGDEPWCVDWYNPQAGEWYLQEPTVQCVDNQGTEVYQYRGLADRIALADVLYYTPQGYTVYGNNFSYVNFPYPLPYYLDPVVTYDVSIESSTYTVDITNKTAQGFSAKTSVINTTWWSYVPRIAVRGPLTDIV